ncbi:MAG: hypothetical protein IJ646_10780 [Clostridia bacterium]|nr:hypothetical protein [Clostridia bacterium]
MRCACHVCDTYMVHSEGLALGCVCPNCGYRCKACLGTDSVISRDSLKNIQYDPTVMNDILSSFDDEEDDDPDRW